MKLLFFSLSAVSLFAADGPPVASQIFDRQLANLERHVVSLVEAMPADMFNFAPTNGAWDGVRTFAQYAKHIAYEIDNISCGLLGEPIPSASSKAENGPDDIKTKEQVARYVKDAFAHAHKAIASLTNDNLMLETTNPFYPQGKITRVELGAIISWGFLFEYGQMEEYAHMNNIVPPMIR